MWYPSVPSKLQRTAFLLFLWLYSILLCIYSIGALSICLLLDIRVVSIFWPLYCFPVNKGVYISFWINTLEVDTKKWNCLVTWNLLFLVVWEITLSSIGIKPDSIPTGSERDFSFYHTSLLALVFPMSLICTTFCWCEMRSDCHFA